MGEGNKSDHSDDQSTLDDPLALHSEHYQEPVSPILRYKERSDFATLGEILETWTQQFSLDEEDEDEDPAEDGTLCTGPLKMWRPPQVVRQGWCRLRLDTTSTEAHTLVQYRELLRQVMTRVPQYKMCSELALRELVKNMELFRLPTGAVICKPPPKKQQRHSVHGRHSNGRLSRHSIRPSVLGDSGLGDSGVSSFDKEEELEVAHLLLNGTALVFPNGFRIPETLPSRWYTKVALSTSREAASPRYANVDVNTLTAWGLRPRGRTRAGSVAGLARSLNLHRPTTSNSTGMQGFRVQNSSGGGSPCTSSRLHYTPAAKRQSKQRRGVSVTSRPALSPNDCLPGARTVPPYRVLDPVSPHEGGSVTICALENSIVAVIPRAFLHSSELEKEADKVERRRQRYALNQAALNGQPLQQQKTRKSHQFAMASTLKQVMKEAIRKTAAQTAHEKVQSSQQILKKKLLASTLQSTICAADPEAVMHLPETPEDVQDLFPSLSSAQAEKVFEELAPENAKTWRAAQDRKKEDSSKFFGKGVSSWQRLQQGFRRVSTSLQSAAHETVVLNTEAAEFEKINEHWNNIREEMGLSSVMESSKASQKELLNPEKFAHAAEYTDAKAGEGGIWKSEPIFVKAMDSGEIGTQSAVDGSLQEFLSHVPAFASLREKHAPDGRSWEQVYNMFTVKRVPEGTSLLEEGELTDRIIGIMSGEVEVSSTIQFRESSCRPRNILIREKQTDVGDASVAFRILGPGEFLGHFRPAAQPYRSLITARARTACRVCRSSAASVCGRVFMHLLDGGGQMMEDLHDAATGWMPKQQELRKIMIQQRQWAAFKDRTVQQVVADPINRTAQTAFQRAPGAAAWLQGGEADAYRGDVPTINLADGGPASIRGGRPTSATLAHQLKDVRSTTSLVPYASRLRDKSPANGADLAMRRCGPCLMVRNQATLDGSTRPCSAPGGLRRSASEPGANATRAGNKINVALGASIAALSESQGRKSNAES